MGYIIIAYFAIFLAGVFGYITNIVTLVHSTALTGEVVARAIGLFLFPLGAIMGYF